MGETILTGVYSRNIWRPSLFPIGSLDKLMIPIGSLFQLQYDFLALVKGSVLEGRREM